MIQEYNNKPIYKAYFGENSVVLNVGGSSGTPKINLQQIGLKFIYSTITEIPEWADWEGITNMENMFQDCSNLTTIPLIDTSKVTTMSDMFSSCTSLTTIPQLDTSKVTNMYGMFYNCNNLTTIPQLDTSKVTSMGSMFYYCQNLASIPQLDTSKVTSMERMFYTCSKLTTIPQLDTSKVISMISMFNNCTSLTTIPQLDTSKVTSMYGMFGKCTSLVSVPPLRADVLNDNSGLMGSDLTALTDFGGLINLKYSITGSYGFQRCPNLSYQSCINILNGLYDFTGNGETPTSNQGKLKVHSNFLSLVGDELSIGTNKGWTITA